MLPYGDLPSRWPHDSLSLGAEVKLCGQFLAAGCALVRPDHVRYTSPIVFDWTVHLMGGKDRPLGLKKLREPSKRAATFANGHTELKVVQDALHRGSAGEFVPNMSDTGNSVSVASSFYFLEKLLNDSGVADLALVGSGQTFGSYLEEKIAIGLREMLEESGIDSYYVASKSSSSGARKKSAFELTSYWPFMSAPGVTENPEIETVYKRMGRGHLIQPDVVVWRQSTKQFAHVSDGRVEIAPAEIRELYACISGKATIRSDRSQSSRYERKHRFTLAALQAASHGCCHGRTGAVPVGKFGVGPGGVGLHLSRLNTGALRGGAQGGVRRRQLRQR